MKYFTREWIKNNSVSSLHLLLFADRGADVFSEEHFREVYDDALATYLETKREVFEAFKPTIDNVDKIDNIYEYMADDGAADDDEPDETDGGDDTDADTSDGTGAEETFDEAAETDAFVKVYEERLALYTEVLPDDIKKNIVDMRVLALGKATKKVMHQIEKFCVVTLKDVNKVSRRYADYFLGISAEVPDDYRDELTLKTTKIAAVDITGDGVCISLDNSESDSPNQKLILKDGIATLDEGICGNYWTFDEIYITDDGFELDILAKVPFEEKYAEARFTCTDIGVITDGEDNDEAIDADDDNDDDGE